MTIWCHYERFACNDVILMKMYYIQHSVTQSGVRMHKLFSLKTEVVYKLQSLNYDICNNPHNKRCCESEYQANRFCTVVFTKVGPRNGFNRLW